jgi:hypothetical protein
VISRADFIFSVGFDGDSAIVDASAKRAYGRLTTVQLAEKGLFKAAVASAFYEKNERDMAEVLAIYNKDNVKPLPSMEALKRTFGVLETFDQIDKEIRV